VPLLNKSELEMKEVVASLQTFRPSCTVFEIKGKHTENAASLVMESKRVLHSDVPYFFFCLWLMSIQIIQKQREKEKQKKQRQHQLQQRLQAEETKTKGKKSLRLTLPSERQQKDYKDPNFFLSHTKDNYHSEKGYFYPLMIVQLFQGSKWSQASPTSKTW
jgi:hypothetical protein